MPIPNILVCHWREPFDLDQTVFHAAAFADTGDSDRVLPMVLILVLGHFGTAIVSYERAILLFGSNGEFGPAGMPFNCASLLPTCSRALRNSRAFASLVISAGRSMRIMPLRSMVMPV